MSGGNLTVIVPTYNRKTILKKTLEAYGQQTAGNEILEILVVDDGSTDGTGHLVSEFARTSAFPIRYLQQKNSGLAAARNHGIREARGKVILFADDDIIPAPNMVAEHLAWHRKYPDLKTGVLGNVPYSPEVNPTPFQQWWGAGGVHFNPPYMYPEKGVSFSFLVFGNTSVKSEFLREIGAFDENFRTWGCEDTDYAYRLVQKGGKVLFNPDAVGYHYKRVLFSEACRVPEKSASSYRYFATKEAGIKYFELQRRWENVRRHRIKRLLARCVVPMLFPLRPVLDSQIQLPRRVYDMFFLYHAELKNAHLRPK
ncbi:MAG: glycosyltransferase family 2 protein [Candidatus Micrarchaeaceae archaeon]